MQRVVQDQDARSKISRKAGWMHVFNSLRVSHCKDQVDGKGEVEVSWWWWWWPFQSEEETPQKAQKGKKIDCGIRRFSHKSCDWCFHLPAGICYGGVAGWCFGRGSVYGRFAPQVRESMHERYRVCRLRSGTKEVKPRRPSAAQSL